MPIINTIDVCLSVQYKNKYNSFAHEQIWMISNLCHLYPTGTESGTFVLTRATCTGRFIKSDGKVYLSNALSTESNLYGLITVLMLKITVFHQ